MKKGKITRKRVKKALKYISDERKTECCHDKTIEDIVIILAKEKYMSSYIALNILDDVKEVISLISEVKLL